MPELPSQGTILVADDEPLVLNLAGTILRRQGYRVIVAPDGSSALEQFHKQPIDLVVTDVVMPMMTGPQLMHRIHQENSDVPCIFMSGYTSEQIKEAGAGDPGCDYLHKPFTPDALLKLVRQQLAS